MAAVEHDAGWAQWVGDQLDREGIGDDVVVIHAPLLPHRLAEQGRAAVRRRCGDRGTS